MMSHFELLTRKVLEKFFFQVTNSVKYNAATQREKIQLKTRNEIRKKTF